MKSASEDEIIAHCEAVAREIPLVGFYLQPAVGGVILSADFWRRFASIDNVIAIKIAPFNRYRTLDVLRGVAAAGALDRVALYTGNDDHILLDLMLPFDLRERAMLGDVGSNLLGAVAGLWLVLALSSTGEAIALLLIATITLFGEFRSISAFVERNPLLRRLDSLGRLRGRGSGHSGLG